MELCSSDNHYTMAQMLDWVLNTPLTLECYYLHGLSRSMYILLLKNVSKMQLQDCNIVEDQGFNYFRMEVSIIQKPVICSFQPLIIITKSSILGVAVVLDPPLLMVQLEINWRGKLKLLTDPALYLFFQKIPLISYVWILFSHIYSVFCGLELFQARDDSC